MTLSKHPLFVAVAAFAIVFFASPSPSHADSYTFFDLGSANNGRDPLGITSTGTVVISTSGLLFETYTNGALVASSTTNPNLVFDNGSSCSPSVSGAIGAANVSFAACNGTREVFSTNNLAPSPFENSIFDGPDPGDFVASHMVDDAFRLNASGDFLFIADQNIFPSDGEIFEAIDLSTLPTPEPGSIFLLGTGALAAAGAMRRRLLK
jgi:hypothetical protein